MIQRPSFNPCLHVESVSGHGTILLSERGHFMLTGHVYDMVLPLIDGQRTADEIADILAGRARMDEIYYALAVLERDGHLVEASDDMPAEQQAFWTALGVTSDQARRHLAGTRVVLRAAADEDRTAMARALARMGLEIGEAGNFTVVMVRDYLDPGLAALNAAQLASGKPWVLCKPGGTVTWMGPMFVPGAPDAPGTTGCWECLAQRLRDHRQIEAFLARKGHAGPFTIPCASLPASREQAIQTTALHVAIYAGAGENHALAGTVITTDMLSNTTRTHRLVRRPQCPACGHPDRDRGRTPTITLADAVEARVRDGGRRSATPQATFERYQHHISPITGIVHSLEPITGDGPLRVYVAGHNPVFKSNTLHGLGEGLRSRSAGKGVTDAQARTSALCEALERYSGIHRGDEPSIRARYRDLGERAIHPGYVLLFSERQYRERERWRARGSPYQIVPEPFREDVEIEWTPVYSMTLGTPRYLPTGYLYYGYPLQEGSFFYYADSNGNAAGNGIEEAIQQGFLELVERDAVCLWWYNRIRRPQVDLDSLADPYIEELRAYYRRQGRELWVLDVTADMGIPTFVAVSRRTAEPIEDIIMGFGAHLDARTGILRAITEMNQFMPAVLERLPDGRTRYLSHDPHTRGWWQNATLANQPYLQPLPEPFTRTLGDYDALCAASIAGDVQTCLRIAHELGMEVLVLDQTQPDVGLPVVKVIVPGMRHFWPRFAPGRLYDVPVKLGWLAHPMTEEQLNPIAMFL